MALRVQVPKTAGLVRFLLSPAGKVAATVAVLLTLTGAGIFTYYWIHFARLIEKKLTGGPFANTAMLFAAPEMVSVGDSLTPDELVAMLRRRGYTESSKNRMGWYNVRPDGVEVFPGADSYLDDEPGVIFIRAGNVTRIISNRDNTERPRFPLEPELITNLFDQTKREKRRLVKFEDIPKHLVNAVVSVEDKRFFQHSGFDPLRVIRAIIEDLKERRMAQGASTLSMQLARMFWLTQDKNWKRKAAEAMITLQLEQKLTKEQIFEFYSNQVDLGRRKSFAVHGFGEAAQAYLGKDIREVNLPDAALLAGMIQRPNFFNPYRHPERAVARRNLVLGLMRENGYITENAYAEAVASPLKLAQGGAESVDAPYFVDLVNDDLQEQFQDVDFQNSGYRVYTTLDLKLQRDAVEAVQIGIKEVDEQLAKRKKRYPEAQVALVALDPQTAEVKALVGGRSYGASQLNRALARRQPGSIFKPFVYAAALSTALDGGGKLITPLTAVFDEPTTFWFDGKAYEPNNFRSQFFGLVTLRQALAKSMNIPTVKFAEMAGYDRVVRLARKAGMNDNIKATPAVALGSYEVTPLEIASAYTVFSNGGTWTKASYINQIRSQSGGLIYDAKPQRGTALDPRVAYMVVNLMQEVMRSGTGAGARSRGFGLPAAGKTGTSHDAWFAGFTTKLLCVVWVGFDDNQELPLEGAKAALPIWTEFMKRAHRYREYRGVREFDAPDGIVTVDVDPSSGMLATSSCPAARAEVFVAGTQPADLCRLHGGYGRTQIAAWDVEQPDRPAVASSRGDGADGDSVRPAPRRAPERTASPGVTGVKQPPAEPAKEQKKGFWGRIRDIFK